MQNAYRKPSPNSGFEPTACYEAALLTTPCHRAVLKKKKEKEKKVRNLKPSDTQGLGKADDITCHTFISKVFNFPHFSFSKCRNML